MTLAHIESVVRATEIVVSERQLRVTAADATAALDRVMGQPAGEARSRLRFSAASACEPLARMLDKALIKANSQGLDDDALVISAGSAVAAEDIVRIRRKAHGLADWIHSPTSDVTVVLRPKGLAGLPTDFATPTESPAPAVSEPVLETEAELEVREALFDVIDPDLGVNVVDLGFVRRVRIADDGLATITMTLTSAACPLTAAMESQIKAIMAEMDTDFVVNWEWLPTWKPADITIDGREQLRAIGFSAF
jgi:metal-sulfur cluster biosynthetic enzyme/ribosomal protein L22